MGQTITGDAEQSFSWDARVLASLMLPYDISIQATGNLRSRGAITQGYRRSNQSLDLGLRKSFFNKTIVLSINWRDPRVNITISWNFGNMNKDKKPEEQEGQQQQPDDNNQQNQNQNNNFGGDGFDG